MMAWLSVEILIAALMPTAVVLGHLGLYLRDRRKAAVEAKRIEIEARTANAAIQTHEDEAAARTQEVLTEQFEQLIKAREQWSQTLLAEVRRLTDRVDRLSQHVDVLRAALAQHGITPPAEPSRGQTEGHEPR